MRFDEKEAASTKPRPYKQNGREMDEHTNKQKGRHKDKDTDTATHLFVLQARDQDVRSRSSVFESHLAIVRS
jgi:hypothetical protein